MDINIFQSDGPSAAQTTLAAFYRLTFEGHRILIHILTCSPTLPRPTSAASAAKQDQQPSAARLSGSSVAAQLRRTGLKWLAAAHFAASKLRDRPLQYAYCPDMLFLSAASAAARNTTGPRRHVSLDETTRHKPLGRNGTELTWRPWIGAIASSTEQRSGRLGFFSYEGFSQGCTVLGLQLLAILGIMVLLPLGVKSYLIYLRRRILGWRGMSSR
ncbi:hypothetical protein FMEXI_7322 [Fusarium mexicanum]|uniref:Uncharacterized protein n=1 Tax=Fusarium mexicanum TaxID=751941 RepID=A0A8H5MWH3_9HYPO|nr:hypothetical protein FMEXI_7322 [Fusarium mexicanum]